MTTCKNSCYRYDSKEQPCPWNHMYEEEEDFADDCVDFVGVWDKEWIAKNTVETNSSSAMLQKEPKDSAMRFLSN